MLYRVPCSIQWVLVFSFVYSRVYILIKYYLFWFTKRLAAVQGVGGVGGAPSFMWQPCKVLDWQQDPRMRWGMGVSKPPLVSSRGAFRSLAFQNMFAVPHPNPCCGTQLPGLMPLKSLQGMGCCPPQQSVSQPLCSSISGCPGTNKGLNLWSVHSGLEEALHFRDRKLSIIW